MAAVLALTIAIVGLTVGQDYAFALATQYVTAVGDKHFPIKWGSLTFQRAALADGHYLPIYGSSELYCCGDPFYPMQVFDTRPSGFDAYYSGGLGTGDLLFLETFGALGNELRGKKLALSESPPYFFSQDGIADPLYAGNFSPEIAEGFLFNSPISLDLREAGARRMLQYPDTLKDQPLTRLAVSALADPSPLHLAAYEALVPLGQLDFWILQLKDARATVQFIWGHPELKQDLGIQISPPWLDWMDLVAQGTQIMQQRTTDNPWGWPKEEYARVRTEETKQLVATLTVFCSGRTNRDGELFPEPVDWEKAVRVSAEWTDLELEIKVLEELGAQPLVYSLPMPGNYDNYTNLSAKARQTYYQKYRLEMAKFPAVPSVDFSQFDEDRYILTDTGAHFSARGWLIADRLLDMHWHGRTGAEMQAAVDAMNRAVPPTGPAQPSPLFCSADKLRGG
jgi:D-alanine transfer protein